jgi:hypothetical protein
MKHQKKNTRRRHKSRNKTRKPRNTHKKYKRCRTRRGGNPKEKVYAEVLEEYKKSTPLCFNNNHDTFKNFLDVYGASELQKVVCGDYSEKDIRLHETQHLNTIKQLVTNVSNPTPKIIFIKDLFLTPKFINSWTDFVISLKNSVDARSSADFPPPLQLHPGLAIPLPKRVLEQARPAIPVHVQQPEPGPPLPEGWSRYGPDHAPFYTNNLTGKSQNDFPTMPAALEKRLAQIKNLDYNPPDLSTEDKRRAKEVGADLPEILIPPGVLND